MSKYMIQASHTDAECLKALKEIVAKDPRLLKNTHFGCMGGDHKGWMVLEAKDETAARNKLPKLMHSNINVVKVDKFTPGQIRLIHEV